MGCPKREELEKQVASARAAYQRTEERLSSINFASDRGAHMAAVIGRQEARRTYEELETALREHREIDGC